MTEAVNVSVDVPPSVNHLYYNATYKSKDGKGHCRRVLTRDGKIYKESMGYIIKMAANHAGWTYNGERLSIGLTLTFKDNRRRDITNCIKIIEDAAAEALGFDDTVVDAFFVRRAGVDRHNPSALLSIAKVLPPETKKRRPPPTLTTPTTRLTG